MKDKLFIFDIETAPLPLEQIEEVAPEFKPESIKVGNLSIEKAQAKITAARDSHLTRITESAALHAEYGQVVSIGTILGSEEMLFITDNEATKIAGFWTQAEEAGASGYQMVGHNIFGFDLPFLVRRSYTLGIKPPGFLMPARGRYWGYPWFDTMAAWSLGDFQSRISLDRFAKHLGLEGKSGSGKYYYKLLEENPDEAIAYLRQDLKVTKAVAEKIIPLLKDSEVGR